MSETLQKVISILLIPVTLVIMSFGMRYIYSAKVERDVQRTSQPVDNPERNLRQRPLIGASLVVVGVALFIVAVWMARNVIIG
jgi:hypothetical protein